MRAALAAILTLLMAATAQAQVPAPTPTIVPSVTPEPSPEPTPPPPPKPTPPVVDATVADDTVTTLNGGPAHAGAVTGTIGAPLGVAWTAKVNGRQLLAVPGTVVAAGPGGVAAFDATSGARRWAVPGYSSGAAIAGDVVVVASHDHVTAYALVDGVQRWRIQHTNHDPPVPAGDLVLVQNHAVRALDAATGAERWSYNVSNPGSPAVVGDRVYVSECQGGYTVHDRRDGRLLHERDGGCSGGISYSPGAVGRTVRMGYYEGQIDAETFAERPAVRWTAARPGIGLLDAADTALTVKAVEPGGGGPLWETKLPFIAGTNFLAGNTAVVASREGVALLDASSGALLWAGRFSEPVHTGSSAGEVPAIAALGSVFVMRGDTLMALRPGVPPPPATLTGRVDTVRVIEYGRSFDLDLGLTQDPLIVARDVIVYAKRATSRSARRQVVSQTRLDERFPRLQVKLKPSLTTDYELTVAGGTNSRRFSAIVVPDETARVRRGGADNNTITVRVGLRVPKSISLGGRRFGFYVARTGRKRYHRLAVGRITRTGRGRGRVTVRFRATNLRGNDFFRSCVSGVSAKGMSWHDRLDRACGRASVRF